jgi:hypothetical protein
MAITNGYATLAEVKASLRITDTVDDTLLELAIESASRSIDEFAGRVFYSQGSAVRFFAAESSDFVAIDDLISITELATSSGSNNTFDLVWTGYNSGSPVDYQLEPLNNSSATDGVVQPVTGIRSRITYAFPTLGDIALVRVTGTWGWSAVPTAIKQATVIQAARYFKRNDSPLGVLSAPDLGYIRVGSRLDPDVEMMISGYRRVRGVA